jgi:hypothetical protein
VVEGSYAGWLGAQDAGQSLVAVALLALRSSLVILLLADGMSEGGPVVIRQRKDRDGL